MITGHRRDPFFLALAAFLVLAGAAPGCERDESRAAPEAGQTRVADGTWGATGVRLEVTGDTAVIEFDCAHGTLKGPLTLDGQHRFSVAGAFVRERGGPQREDDPPPEAATYSGQVEEETMNLAVRVGATDIGAFRLTHGGEARLRKCL